MSRLEATGVSVTLGGNRILSSIDVSLEGGCLIGFIGPNGAGKTTLLKSLAGLIDPAAGEIRLDGAPLASLPRRARARAIGYLPQTSSAAWPLPVRDIVALGRLPFRRPFGGLDDADQSAVDAALRATGTGDLANRKVNTLSGGERARVLLARALAGKPRILLADEPVAGLDPYHRLEAIEHFRGLADAGTTVVVVLHDLTLAARFCDRLVMLNGGRIVNDNAPGDVLTPEGLSAVYKISALTGLQDGERWFIPWRRENGSS